MKRPGLLSLKSSKGMNLVSLSIAIAMGSLITFGVMNLIFQMQNQQKTLELSATMENVSSQLQNVLGLDGTWRDTIIANPLMSCIRNQTACPTNTLGTGFRNDLPQIRIMAGGQVLLNENDIAFTISGTKCNGIQTTQKDGRCPIRYKVRFYVDRPQGYSGISVTIVAKLIFWPDDKSPYRGKYATYDPYNDRIQKYDLVITKQFENRRDTTIQSCTQDGVTLFEGQSRYFYRTATVALGERCDFEVRTCNVVNNVAVLSGTYPLSRCVQNCFGTTSPCVCDLTAPRPGTVGFQFYQLRVPRNEWGSGACPVDGTRLTCTMPTICN